MVQKRRNNFQFELPFKAVHLECLDREQSPLRHASGAIVREESGLFLYTNWHVVTGFDMHDVRVGLKLPGRRYLRVTLQDAHQRAPGVESIGGSQSVVLRLYEADEDRSLPLWWQDEQDTPHPELNAINLRVPFWHDAVKLPLPSDLHCSDVQSVRPDEIVKNDFLVAGDTVYIVGYPYGYSPLGMEQPTPVVITRHVAATRISGRRREILLDGPAAEGMSGGPVFLDRGDQLPFLGLYTGLIYPDHDRTRNPTTALGTFCDLMLTWTPPLGLKSYRACSQKQST